VISCDKFTFYLTELEKRLSSLSSLWFNWWDFYIHVCRWTYVVTVEDVSHFTHRSFGNRGRNCAKKLVQFETQLGFLFIFPSFSHRKAESRTVLGAVHWDCLEPEQLPLWWVSGGKTCNCTRFTLRTSSCLRWRWRLQRWALLGTVVACSGSQVLTFAWNDLGHSCDRVLHLFVRRVTGPAMCWLFCLMFSSYLHIPVAKIAHFALRCEKKGIRFANADIALYVCIYIYNACNILSKCISIKRYSLSSWFV
jgi:hypothetical protein